MNPENEYTLLQAGPEHNDAKELLFNVTGFLFDYLQNKSFSNEIRYGRKDEQTNMELQKLHNTRTALIGAIEKAKNQQIPVAISLIINIQPGE
jgi:hypothetical protein